MKKFVLTTLAVMAAVGVLAIQPADDEDALSEELIEMAGVKEIYKKPKKEDSDDYII